MGFLGVIIEPDGIKIEEEKMKGVVVCQRCPEVLRVGKLLLSIH